MSSVTFFNKHFRFVFTGKETTLFSRRFLVGAGALQNYVGEKNAETVLKAAINSKKDKTILKFRKCGKIEIYVK